MDRRKQQVEREVKKTLQLLEGIENIEPEPYFYTRLQARLEQQEAGKDRNLVPMFRQENLRLSVFTMVIIINIISGIYFLQKRDYPTVNRSQTLDAIAKEYSMTQEYFIY